MKKTLTCPALQLMHLHGSFELHTVLFIHLVKASKWYCSSACLVNLTLGMIMTICA